jgi:hypothetical protein
VEILLALSVLSVILLLLLSAFTGAGRAREILYSRSREFRQIRLSMDRIGTDLQGAFAASNRDDTALLCREDQFSGKPAATLVFLSFRLPETGGSRPPADTVKVKYFPRVGSDGASLELHREQSDLPLIENRIPSGESLIAEGLRGFRVELWDGAAWVREWPPSGRPKTALPKKAAVTLVDARGETFRREIPIPLAGREGAVTSSGRRTQEKFPQEKPPQEKPLQEKP